MSELDHCYLDRGLLQVDLCDRLVIESGYPEVKDITHSVGKSVSSYWLQNARQFREIPRQPPIFPITARRMRPYIY